MMEKGALAGIKVLDFTWVNAGPGMTRHLALHGATVVHIESETRVDPIRLTSPYKDGKPGINRTAAFTAVNTNKYGITLNVNHPRGKEVFKRLVRWSDVLVENHTPGFMQKLGLGYDELVKVRPDLIMLQSSNQGQTGPQARVKGFGIHLEGLAGFTYLSGWPDKDPVVMAGLVTDWFSGHLGVCALLAALDYRQRTNEGQYIDISQCEAGFQLLAAPFLDYTVNGRVAERRGSRLPYAAPHNIYPCRGEDCWCAITVFSDEEWGGFCEAAENAEWTREPRFATLLGRKENEEELDRLVTEWTRKFSAEEVMRKLQAKGVRAGVVMNTRDLHQDPQLEYRRHFVEMEHREIGKHRYEDESYRLSETPAEFRMAAPCLGEHNYYVYTDILGMSDEEFTELLAEGIFE